uniref:Cyclin-like domain-containing protein n=1 Tax=Trichuris muris TaxID=70415 RepID=A0A5S6QE08_TRIMR
MASNEDSLSLFNLPRLYSHVQLSLENAILPAERLSRPPSLDDGLDMETERNLRFLGCQLIQSASILLRIPQVAAAAGQVLYQRFYYAKSFVRCNFEHTAMACVYLASKIEETPRRIRDVVNVFHHMKQLQLVEQDRGDCKRLSPMALDHRYVTLKNEVIKAERRVLKELGFCVHVKHPHKLIYVYLKALDALDNTDLLQKAWNYMNDSLRTDVFMRYPPETIACSCVFLAARSFKIGLPMKRPWWQLFDAKDEDVIEICNILLNMYAAKPVNWMDLDDRLNQLRDRYLREHAVSKAAQIMSAVTPQHTVVHDQMEDDNANHQSSDSKKMANGHSGKRTSGGEPSPAPPRHNRRHESSSPLSDFHEKQSSSSSVKSKHRRRRRSRGHSYGHSHKCSSRDGHVNRRQREEEVRSILGDKYDRRPKSGQRIFRGDINHRSNQAFVEGKAHSSDGHR